MTHEYMRGVLVERLGWPQPLPVRQCKVPLPKSHQVLVRVLYAGVNFADTLVIDGSYQEKPLLPFVPGSEVSAEVIGLGSNVHNFALGQRVMGHLNHGAFAEYAVVDQDRLTKVPSSMTDRDAAGFYIPFGTAVGALLHRARLRPNETVLVLGASGGVGQACTQVALAYGARVICAASALERLPEEIRSRVTWIKPVAETLYREVQKATQGNGVDIVVDIVGGEVGEQASRSLRFEGRHVVVGFAAGKPPTLRANHILVKNIDIVGCYWGPYQQLRPQQTKEAFDLLKYWFEHGRIQPLPCVTVDLDDVGSALESLGERRQEGKIVVRIGADSP